LIKSLIKDAMTQDTRLGRVDSELECCSFVGSGLSVFPTSSPGLLITP